RSLGARRAVARPDSAIPSLPLRGGRRANRRGLPATPHVPASPGRGRRRRDGDVGDPPLLVVRRGCCRPRVERPSRRGLVGRDRRAETEIMNALAISHPTLQHVAARRRTATHPGVIERAFAIIVLFLSTGGLLPLLRLEAGVAIDDLEGDRVMQVTWIAVYAITMLLLARRTRETLALLYRERWLGLLCGLAATSILWSVAPDVTLRRTAALFATTGFGIYLAPRCTAHARLPLVA